MNKAKAITNDIVQNAHTQRTIFRVLILSLILLSVVYTYLIGSITFNVLARKTLDTTAHELGSHVSELELSDMTLANKIDKNYAVSIGFVDVQKNIFATRDASVRVALR
jgi:glycerol-3-phosphate acyltransferase PlsY